MKNENLKKISDAVGGITISDTNDYVCASKLISSIGNKDLYFLSIGQHSAIVRKNGNVLEFLEMQQKSSNGWHILDNTSLRFRFYAEEVCTNKNGKIDKNTNFLIPFENLKSNNGFLEMLKFVNTNSFSKKRKKR